MTITSAIVLFSVIWFMILFIVLPLNINTQKDNQEIIRGTAPSAPSNLNLKNKIKLVTFVAFLIWLPIFLIIFFGIFTISDLDFYDKMN